MTTLNPRRLVIAAVAIALIGTPTITHTDGPDLPPVGAFAYGAVSGNAVSYLPNPMADEPIVVVAPSAMMPAYAEVARYVGLPLTSSLIVVNVPLG
jgi:hypothetical protein